MDQRQRQDHVGLIPVLERLTLQSSPTQTRRGVGDVVDERKDIRRAIGLQMLIVTLDGKSIDIRCNDLLAVFGGDRRELTRIRTQISTRSHFSSISVRERRWGSVVLQANLASVLR
jgi:hypothetical protein